MQVVNVKYVERSLSMDGTIMRGTYRKTKSGEKACKTGI